MEEITNLISKRDKTQSEFDAIYDKLQKIGLKLKEKEKMLLHAPEAGSLQEDVQNLRAEYDETKKELDKAHLHHSLATIALDDAQRKQSVAA